MASCKLPTTTSTADTDQSSSKCQFWQTDVGDDQVVHDSSCAERDVEDASSVLQTDLFADDATLATSSVAPAVDSSEQTGCKHRSNSRLQDLPASTEGDILFTKLSVFYVRYNLF